MLKQFLNVKTLLMLGFLGLASFGLAQPGEPISLDLGEWFVSTAALSGVVWAAVAFLKEHILKSVHGLVTVGVSLALGAALGVVGHFTGHLDGGIGASAMFGLTAGFLASGFRDALVGVLGKASEE